MQTISFYSYKGGTGRTLTLANFAIYLALLGQKVVALDFDLEAPGLHYKLLPHELQRLEKGVLDYIIDNLHKLDERNIGIKSYVSKIPARGINTGEIWLMPSGDAPSASYGRKLSQLNWHDLLFSDGSIGPFMFLEMKEKIRSEIQPDFLLIDSRTGITDIGGVATTLLADKLICLMLSNRESLEGTRTMLRAIQAAVRPPGMEPISIFPVLSRVGEEDNTKLGLLKETVKSYLNEPSEDLSTSLLFNEVDLLANDINLMGNEKLLVGGSDGSDAPILLSQYLKLFYKIVPTVVQEQTTPIINRALSVMLDDPDGAQGELESLAFSSDAPTAYRALLKLYNVRNADYSQMYPVARRLWEFNEVKDLPILSRIIEKGFAGIFDLTSEGVRHLEFVEDVWRRENLSPKVAIDLSESYENIDLSDKALQILGEALESQETEELVVSYMTQLRRMEKYEDIKVFVQKFRSYAQKSKDFRLEWARSELDSESPQIANELLQPDVIKQIEKDSPSISVRILQKAGRTREAYSIAVRIFNDALEDRDERGCRDAFQLMRIADAEREAEARLIEVFGSSQAEAIIRAASRRSARRGAGLNRFA